ncbi:MAG: 16S rRNA (cytidine(1402)-2'-O)-methyltransferase [Oscillospiraceae bacterium]|nr:16S rRNA (cytidine(1402)-2'-O)-methyltransferase [Oscillospiraceae bacterium]
MSDSTSGTLYIVATPIGNLGDLSPRAAKTLNDVDFIAAEDTRVTLKLLAHLDIKKQMVSYYTHNHRDSGEKILKRILSGENCALVTDAGTPAISDPGEELVRLCVGADIRMITIPGPCAAIAALAMSGLISGRFTFEGFLSTSRKSRFEHLSELKTEKRTMIFYEAPHKLLRTLADMLDVWGERQIAICRELTKIYEEVLRLTLSEAILHFNEHNPRGEFVLIIEGAAKDSAEEITVDDALSIAFQYIDTGLSVKDAAKNASEETGISKNIIYNLVQKKR